MSDGDPLGGRPGTIELERSMLLSDAVFASAITLLVLEIKVRDREAIHSSAELARALGGPFRGGSPPSRAF